MASWARDELDRPTRSRMIRIVVVGGSLAGLRACETLRSAGFGGTITLIGAERHRPYDRPPLSKQFLAGTWDADRIALRKDDAFDALGLDVRLGVPAAGLDLDARSVSLADGSDVPFDGLIIATGAHPRRLPGQPDTPNVHMLRSLDDAIALRAAIVEPGVRVVVIGAGFIGLEVAATARQAGAEVVVLEGAPAPLIRGAGAELGTALAAIHPDNGVDIRTGVAVAGIEDGGVRLGDSTLVAADHVVVGIGVAPTTAWLDGSGLELRDGVVTRPTLSTGVPGVFAAGDLVRWHNPTFDEEMRVEHWTNAAEHGALAARNLLAVAAGGEAAEYTAVPFVWSDQYEHRIQFLGRSTTPDGAAAESRVVIGSPDERRFLAFYESAGRLRGVLGLNVPRFVMRYRALLDARAGIDDALALAAGQRASTPPA
jgi:NADPH-dependent 2,4-dienoyl-CoA reductase/sulfur reductase-like enzyme